MRNRTLLIAILSTATLFGCKKKKEEGADKEDKVVEPAGGGGSMAAPTPAPATPPAATPPAATPPAAGGIASTDDYKAKAAAINAKTVEVFKETDCDKLAAGMTGMLDTSKADMDATNVWEKAHPDDKKAFEEASMKEMEAATKPAMEKCKDNAAFKAAAEKMNAAGG